jgi:hypothetical protein
VLSTDAVVHELYADPEVVSAVRERFGAEVLDAGAAVDRAALAARAFATADDRSWLEGLLWPRVGARVAAWRETEMERRPPPAALVVEVPLLFEAGLEAMYDATVAIVAPETGPSAPAPGATRRSKRAGPASSPRPRRPSAPPSPWSTTPMLRRWSAGCRRSLPHSRSEPAHRDPFAPYRRPAP